MNTTWQRRGILAVWLAVVGGGCVSYGSYDQLAYVSDGTSSKSNWDIYLRDMATGITTQLTTHPAIDNHPSVSPNGEWVVFSSSGRDVDEFDLYLGDTTNVEATLRRLTDDSYPNGPQTSYPDRHPHFHPNGRMVIFTSKNQPLEGPIEVASECSTPVMVVPPRFYEKLNVIKLDATGVATELVQLDLRGAWNQTVDTNIWVTNPGTYAGHPSFSHGGTQIVFSASIDGQGTEWEVYTVGFDTNTISLVSNSLRRITDGPAMGPNPIQMSGAGHFSEDDSEIYFSSTRTPAGNSLIFSVAADGANIPVTSATQRTCHGGNDYTPEPLTADGDFLVVSDLGTNPVCAEALGPTGVCMTAEGPTPDLDIFYIDLVGARTNLTGNDGADELLLIGDEVSWFCGLKPNLSSCTYLPRVMNTEALWLERQAYMYDMGLTNSAIIPPDLLSRFGYPDQAIPMYAHGWMNMNSFMNDYPAVWTQVLDDVEALEESGFPGFANTNAFLNWMQATTSLRQQKHVVPSIMYRFGLGRPWNVCTWINPVGGDLSASNNWDCGVPGPFDIAFFTDQISTGKFDLVISLPQSHTNAGVLVTAKDAPLGGTFSSDIPVQPAFVFTRAFETEGCCSNAADVLISNIVLTVTNASGTAELRVGPSSTITQAGGTTLVDRVTAAENPDRPNGGLDLKDGEFIVLRGPTTVVTRNEDFTVGAGTLPVEMLGMTLSGGSNIFNLGLGACYVGNPVPNSGRGLLRVDGAATSLDVPGLSGLWVGCNNTACEMRLGNGATVTSQRGAIGFQGSYNEVSVVGAGSRWNVLQDLQVGAFNGFGNRLLIDEGGLVQVEMAVIGAFGNGNRLDIQTGGAFQATDLLVGDSSFNNQLLIGPEGDVRTEDLVVGAGPLGAANVVDVFGRLTVSNGAGFGLLEVRNGTMNVDGGTVEADEITAVSPNSELLFPAGVLRPGSATVSNGVPFNVGDDPIADGIVDLTDFALFQTSHHGTYDFANGLNILEDGDLSGDGVIGLGDLVLFQAHFAGSCCPGKSAGILTIDGSVVMTNTATLNIELGGTTPGTGYDRLVVTGNATLDGTLRATLIDAFTPTNGDAFAVLTYGSRSNEFAGLDLPILDADQRWDVSYGSTSMTLSVAAIIDIDGDGMDDEWEIDNFGSITNSDGTGNFDGDPHTDFEEYIVLTHPTNALSSLRITNFHAQGSNADLSFFSVYRLLYRVEDGVNLITNGGWTERTSTWGTGSGLTISNLPANATGPQFYRLNVQR